MITGSTTSWAPSASDAGGTAGVPLRTGATGAPAPTAWTATARRAVRTRPATHDRPRSILGRRGPAGRRAGSTLGHGPGRQGLGHGPPIDVLERGHDRPDGAQRQAVLGHDGQHGTTDRAGLGALVDGHDPGRGAGRQGVPEIGRRIDRGDAGHRRQQIPAALLERAIGRVEADFQLRRAVAEARGQLLERALADEPARGEDADPVAHRLDLVEQVAGQQDGQAALVGQPPEQVQDLDHAERVDGRGRLVEDEQVGVLDQGVGDAQALEHAPRVRLDQGVGAIGQTDLARGPHRWSSRPRRRGSGSVWPCSAGSRDPVMSP